MDVIGIIILSIVVIVLFSIIVVVIKVMSKETNVSKKASNKSKTTPETVLLRNKSSSRNVPARVTSSSQRKSKTLDLEWIKEQIEVDDDHILRLSMGYQFSIPEKHELGLFSKIKITRESRKSIKTVATLRKVFPSYLDIRTSKSSYGMTKDTFSVLDLNQYFKFYSTAPDMWREVFINQRLRDKLEMLSLYIDYYYARGEYMETVVTYDQAAYELLEMTMLIHQGLKELFGVLDSYEVEKLVCYNCEDPFDPMEEVCDKCGSPRPRCIVCLLDLFPSDLDEEIVTTPCCGVYTHRDHIIMWLKQNPNCPNCHENLSHWLGKLQMS